MSIKKYHILILLMVGSITACEKEKCDVPSYPVQFDMQTQSYPYATRFDPGVSMQTVAITLQSESMLRLDFSAETIYMTRNAGDYVGYAGMVVWSDMYNRIHAADLCCPHCLDPNFPIEVDGGMAICPLCSECFDLMSGYATPTKGITSQRLRIFKVSVSGTHISIRN